MELRLIFLTIDFRGVRLYTASTMANKRTFGPAMQQLSERERNFVIALCETGGYDHTKAAVAAGYGENRRDSAKQAAWRLSHRPKVQAAIAEEAQKRLNAASILAATVMVDIANDVNHKDRFKAADRLLERGGLLVATKHEIDVKDDRTIAQLENFIVQKANELGLDPKKLLGSKRVTTVGDVLDAEYEELDGTDEGLEDLL